MRPVIKISCCIVALIALLVAGSANADWQSDLEAQFDIVETFDGLSDWPFSYGFAFGIGADSTVSHQPQKIGGAVSIWDSFDYQAYPDPTADFIKDHGAANVWRGSGKSLKMDMDQDSATANVGPSRLRAYIGGATGGSIDAYAAAGAANSGYTADVYVFEMIKIPSNIFPRTGETYDYFSYFKWFVFATGKTGVNDCDTYPCVETERTRCEYGVSNAHTMLTVNTTGKPHFKLEYYSDADKYTDQGYCNYTGWATLLLPQQGGVGDDFQIWIPTNAESDLTNYIPDWFGLETHIHRGTPGVSDGYQEYWLYSSTGVVAYVGRVPTDYMMVPDGEALGFNYFFQGGNISYQPAVDSQGLDVSYYVDDIIIDNARIGPTYFGMVSGAQNHRAGGAPSGGNPSGWQ